MYTIRAVLWVHKKNKLGLCPLMICVTIDRRKTFFKTPYKLKELQWNGEIIDYPNKNLANAAVRKQMSDLEKNITEKVLSGIKITARDLKKKQVSVRFETYAKEVRENKTHIGRVINFAGSDLMLSEIDVQFLRRFEDHERARGIAQNTRNITFKYIGRIVRQALKEGIIKENPFMQYDKPRYVQPIRHYLEQKDFSKLFKALPKITDPSLRSTTIYFLLGCYSGLRHSDWLKFNADTMVRNDFLKLRTRKNKQDIVLPVGPTLRKVIELTRTCVPPHSNQKCNVYLKAIGNIAGIDKPLTTHMARHSFGNLCASNGLPKSVTAELMGINEQTVNVYYHLSGANIIKQAAILKKI